MGFGWGGKRRPDGAREGTRTLGGLGMRTMSKRMEMSVVVVRVRNVMIKEAFEIIKGAYRRRLLAGDTLGRGSCGHGGSLRTRVGGRGNRRCAGEGGTAEEIVGGTALGTEGAEEGGAAGYRGSGVVRLWCSSLSGSLKSSRWRLRRGVRLFVFDV